MLAIKNVLVATDFSRSSEVALAYGRALARQFGARLHVIHSIEPIVPDAVNIGGYVTAIPELQAGLEETERAKLDALITEDDRRALQATTVLVSFTAPAHAIVEYAAKEHIDVIVVGTHGRRGFSHLLMGSVAEKVVRTAACPVLTVRHPEREFDVAGTVLVATDFGEPACAALAYAEDLAKAFSAALHIVHVVPDLAARDLPMPAWGNALVGLQAQREDDARQQLEAIRDADNRVAKVITAVLVSNSPPRAILDYARSHDVDVIVMGTHGRSGFADLFMGAVAQHVVRRATCPVLTLRDVSARQTDAA